MKAPALAVAALLVGVGACVSLTTPAAADSRLFRDEVGDADCCHEPAADIGDFSLSLDSTTVSSSMFVQAYDQATLQASDILFSLDTNGDGETDFALYKESGGEGARVTVGDFGQTVPGCAVVALFLPSQRAVTMSAPARCIGSPPSVRVSQYVSGPAGFDFAPEVDLFTPAVSATPPPPPPPPPLCPSPGDAGAQQVDNPAVFRSGVFFLRGSYTTGGADVCFSFGRADGDVPVMGDWDGNGTKTPGVFRSGTWYLRNTNSAGPADIALTFGSPRDIPVVGDWNQDGIDTVGVFRSGRWYLRNSNTSGGAEGSFTFGQAGDSPLTGDWNNDGTDTLGVFRGGRWYLSNFFDRGTAEGVFSFGAPRDQPVTGDWNRDGTDTLGVYRAGNWYMSNFFDRGTAEGSFRFGASGDRALLFR